MKCKRLLLVALLAASMALALPAMADSFGPVTLGITNAPCAGSLCVPQLANVATVSAAQSTTNLTQVTFTVQALPGYSIQIQSNNFFDFNTNIIPLSSLSILNNQVTVSSGLNSTTVKADVNTNVSGQSGTGQFSLGLNDLGAPPKINGQTITGADSITFTVLLTLPATVNGQPVNQLLASNFYPQPNTDGWNFQLHFCDGTGPNCLAPTGFVVDSGTPTAPVPEPAGLVLMGGGLLLISQFTRMRKRTAVRSR